MATESAHKNFTLAPRASGRVSWWETFLLTAVVLVLGRWLSPQDPLLIYGTFPWLLLAPVMLGVRYGFMRGLVSAMLLVLALFWYRANGLSLYHDLPASFIVGGMLSSMLVGEIRDIWERRLERLELANEYRQMRLDEFTRAHYILRISHDRLEQRIAGNDQSLRSSLLTLRSQLRALPQDGDAIVALAESILALLASYGSFRVASLHRVGLNNQVDCTPLSQIGESSPMPGDDLLVNLCLSRGQLVSVRTELMERGEGRKHSLYQVCVPLMDTEGRILALLAVEQMPFFAFNERLLSLLTILSGHIADIVQTDAKSLQLADMDAQVFSQNLKRSLNDAEEHDLDAYLFMFEVTSEGTGAGRKVLQQIESSRRGLDVQLRAINANHKTCVLVLLPLTSVEGAQGYLSRLHSLLSERYGLEHDLEQLGVRVHEHDLDKSTGRDALRHFLFKECGLNDQQVAI